MNDRKATRQETVMSVIGLTIITSLVHCIPASQFLGVRIELAVLWLVQRFEKVGASVLVGPKSHVMLGTVQNHILSLSTVKCSASGDGKGKKRKM